VRSASFLSDAKFCSAADAERTRHTEVMVTQQCSKFWFFRIEVTAVIFLLLYYVYHLIVIIIIVWCEIANSWRNLCPSKDNPLPWGAVYQGICWLLDWPTSVYLFVSPSCTIVSAGCDDLRCTGANYCSRQSPAMQHQQLSFSQQQSVSRGARTVRVNAGHPQSGHAGTRTRIPHVCGLRHS